uniref:keratin, type I cytoskeletal 20-like n=1 Tax=Myxine glutinosa TaxID=7769 RepID=UPI00359002E6
MAVSSSATPRRAMSMDGSARKREMRGVSLGRATFGNEQTQMKDLNERLEIYLERVGYLEKINGEAEARIKVEMEQRAANAPDWTRYEKIIKDLRQKIDYTISENASLSLDIDNNQLAGSDFRQKWETENDLRQAVELDIVSLRSKTNDINLSRSELETHLKCLRSDLESMQRHHKEEKEDLSKQLDNGMSVEVDAVKGINLNEILNGVRTKYEEIVKKNQQEAEEEYHIKCKKIAPQMAKNCEALEESRPKVTELRRLLQTLSMEYQSLNSTVLSLEEILQETEARKANELSLLQPSLLKAEENLEGAQIKLNRQLQEFDLLLDAKMNLEREIAMYHKLLNVDGEDKMVNYPQPTPRPSTPTKNKVVKVVTQEIVDGEVVSEVSETQEVLSM